MSSEEMLVNHFGLKSMCELIEAEWREYVSVNYTIVVSLFPCSVTTHYLSQGWFIVN